MQFYGALRAIRDVLREHPDVYVVNEGANALDFARNVIDMQVPRHRLDSGTWGVMGIGMGYAIAAAVESGAPVVAIEGDSAFGFSGMELETICRYRLPVVVIILNNGGVYRGDGVNPVSADPSPTTLMPQARHDRLIEAFGGKGYQATTPAEVTTRAHRSARIGRSGAHRLRDRPRRRHGKRPPHPPQPDRRREAIDTKDRPPERNPS